MRIQIYSSGIIWILAGLALSTVDVGAITNGDFEELPNRTWLTDGRNAHRLAQGDRPGIPLGAKENRYGHIADRDGRGAHGENPSRFFQWFVCEDSLSFGMHHCVVSFRYRTLLVPGELAWVRIRSPNQQRAWGIPNTNNRWAPRRSRLVFPECEGRFYIEFGVINQGGGNIQGRVDVDDVESETTIVEGGGPGPQGDQWDFLPPVPNEEDAEPLPMGETSMIAPPWEGSIALSVLIFLSILLILIKLRR